MTIGAVKIALEKKKNTADFPRIIDKGVFLQSA
jgi:hypothetical protein